LKDNRRSGTLALLPGCAGFVKGLTMEDFPGSSDLMLGLDLGVNSVGWALLKAESKQPRSLVRAGVRVFEAGVEGNFESGKAASRNLDRREARQARRMIERRARRLRKIFNLLESAGLLPHGEPASVLPPLDKELLQSALKTASPQDELCARLPHVLPYWLRAQALDRKLAPYELGRALYHLAQRRGFLSNRKAPPKKDEKPGEVKEKIGELYKLMAAARARTLGEYFAGINPEEERIRKRWTARDMFTAEFDRICSAQAAHHACLSDEFRKSLRRAMFYQRPLKSVKSLIGVCEFEPKRRRAPKALLAFQRFRLLQQVNNTQLITPDGELVSLTAGQRAALIDQLESGGNLTFGQARKLLKLRKGHVFTLEEGGEEKFSGNHTNAALGKIFGPRWLELSAAEKDQAVEDVLSIQSDKALAARGLRFWKLSPEAAEQLGGINLESGYASLSRKAISNLLPHLEAGKFYMNAVEEVYGVRRRTDPLSQLPPVSEAMPHLRNPVVHRVLTELRKVVNAIVREHGKPAMIRIELARDLRKTSKQREETWKRNRANEKLRQRAAQRILEETGVQKQAQSRQDVEKALLWDECNGVCPYTGRSIPFHALFGANPEFDIEHIIPFSRCLDNSFVNKTLCYHEENRNVKTNKTPFEAYGGTQMRWEEILQRVGRFDSGAAREKLRRFQLKEIESLDDFASSQLNDTRYATKEAMRYVGSLYGGTSDASGKLRVAGSKGGATAYLRSAWGLNSLLGDSADAKTRDDHRHHAVDAVVIGLTDAQRVKMLADAAHDSAGRRRLFGELQAPWPGFIEEVRDKINAINVSHRVARKVNGPLHEETFYGKPKTDAQGKKCVHVRKKLESFKNVKELDDIVDGVVRERVRARLDELGGDLKKFADSANHPWLEARDGHRIPIHCVRVRRRLETFTVGDGARCRNVTTDSNHHMPIVESLKNGKPRWDDETIVSRYEASRRLARHEPVIRRKFGEGKRFLFSLSSGELIEMDGERGRREIAVVRSVSKGKIEFVFAQDARKVADIKKGGDWTTRSPEKLRELHCQKVMISPLGAVIRAND
jgi:CRISPR-associated endonuclease Csn1